MEDGPSRPWKIVYLYSLVMVGLKTRKTDRPRCLFSFAFFPKEREGKETQRGLTSDYKRFPLPSSFSISIFHTFISLSINFSIKPRIEKLMERMKNEIENERPDGRTRARVLWVVFLLSSTSPSSLPLSICLPLLTPSLKGRTWSRRGRQEREDRWRRGGHVFAIYIITTYLSRWCG